MMNGLKIAHILIPIALAFLYIYFILFLNPIIWINCVLIIIFTIFFVLYALSLYGLLHHVPGFDQFGANPIEEDKVQELKENGRIIEQLIKKMQQDIVYEDLKLLQKQYLEKYQNPTYCEICKNIKSPRSHHCHICNRCVLRRQKHSQLIDGCVGDRNLKIFIQHLFISMITCFYVIVSLLVVTIAEHHKLQDLSDWELIFFSIVEMSIGAAVMLFGKQFMISYWNAVENISETQRELGVIKKNNNPFDQKYYKNLFHSPLDCFKLRDITQTSNWFELQDEI